MADVTLAEATDLKVSGEPKEYNIKLTNGKVWKVWLREPTWFDRQYAISGWVEFDARSKNPEPKPNFVEYYKRIVERCLVRSEPPITKDDVATLRPEIGTALEEILPGPAEIAITPEEEKKS